MAGIRNCRLAKIHDAIGFYPLLPDVDDLLRTISLTALTVMKKTTLVILITHHIARLLPGTIMIGIDTLLYSFI